MICFIYYNREDNGNVVGVSPVELDDLQHLSVLIIPKDDADPFLTGKESISNWKVDFKRLPKLIKKSDYTYYHYNEHNFFNIEKQLATSADITIAVRGRTIIITRHDNEDTITFFLTERDNPTYLLQKMVLESGVVEKRFFADKENFSIFTNRNFGNIDYVKLD